MKNAIALLCSFALSACGGGGGGGSAPAATYTVGGTVSGLLGTVTIKNSGTSSLEIRGNGSFSFQPAVVSGTNYSVTVMAQPNERHCFVANASGVIASENVTNVAITCQEKPRVLVDANIKEMAFSWDPVPGATYYRLLKNPDGMSAYSQVGSDILSATVSEEISVHLHDWDNARYIVESCDTVRCAPSNPVTSSYFGFAIGVLLYTHQFEKREGLYGNSVAVSSDGETVVVAAKEYDSAASGINAREDFDCDRVPPINCSPDSGAVYVYYKAGGAWTQQAFVKAGVTVSGEKFGTSLALSSDGNTLVVGAPGSSMGAAYVFTRSGTSWTQAAKVTAANAGVGDGFGASIDVSANGELMVVGAIGESSSARGINGNMGDDSSASSGAVYVYGFDGSAWAHRAYIKASNSDAGDMFGSQLRLSADGSTLAVGAVAEASAASGINADESDNSSVSSGAIYVFSSDATNWIQQAYIKASNSEAGDEFGSSIALSANGNALVISTPNEGVGHNSGSAYYFSRLGAQWSEITRIAGPDYSQFGTSVALSSDGNTLAVGVPNEDSTYIYVKSESSFGLHSQMPTYPPDSDYRAGVSVAITGDARTLVVGSVGSAYLY